MTKMVLLLISALMLVTSAAHADFFLDLDIGFHIQDWPDSSGQTPYLGQDEPLGLVRFGYEMPVSESFGWHAYYEHMSSIPEAGDQGINVVFTGVRVTF